MAALHLIRDRSTWDLERRQRGELVRTLLDGEVPPDAAPLLGLDADTAVTVVALRIEDVDDRHALSADLVARIERVAGLVALYFQSFHRRVAQVTIGRTIYVLVPESKPGERERLLRLVGDLVERARATVQTGIVASAGSTVPSIAETSWSRREADLAIRVLASRPGRSLASIEAVRADTILLTLRDYGLVDRYCTPAASKRCASTTSATAPPTSRRCRRTSAPSGTSRWRRSGSSSIPTRSATGCVGWPRSPGSTSTIRSNGSSPSSSCASAVTTHAGPTAPKPPPSATPPPRRTDAARGDAAATASRHSRHGTTRRRRAQPYAQPTDGCTAVHRDAPRTGGRRRAIVGTWVRPTRHRCSSGWPRRGSASPFPASPSASITPARSTTPSHGVTSVENPLPVDDDTLFQFGSTGKTFTATAIMRLVDQGKVDLDAPVRTYLPELTLKDEDVAAASPCCSCSTTPPAGAGDVIDEHRRRRRRPRPVRRADGRRRAGHAARGDRLLQQRVAVDRRAHHREASPGKTYEQAIKELLFEPLGLDHCCFFPNDIMTRRFAVGHNQHADGTITVARPWAHAARGNPAGGISSNAADQIAWARFHLGDGTRGRRHAGAARDAAQADAGADRASMPGSALGDAVGISWMLRDVDGVRVVGHGGDHDRAALVVRRWSPNATSPSSS